MKKEEKNNGLVIIILLLIVVVAVLLFPKIDNLITKASLPKLENDNVKEEVGELDETKIESLHFPLMRNSIYNPNTYYSLNKFSLKDLSNQDILLNAFLDIYEGNLVNSSISGSCTNTPKEFSQNYIELRVNNILGKDVTYTLENFYVPEDSDSKYIGSWIYNPSGSNFIYDGLCTANTSNIKYYDLEQFIKIEDSKEGIVVYYYVGFAKVEGNNYIIYNDASMTKQIGNGTFNSIEQLNDDFNKLNNKDKKIYKYVFKDTLCSYNEYCLYSGEYVNGI